MAARRDAATQHIKPPEDDELQRARTAMAAHPQQYDRLRNVVRLLVERGRAGEALALLDSTLALNPDNADLLALRRAVAARAATTPAPTSRSAAEAASGAAR